MDLVPGELLIHDNNSRAYSFIDVHEAKLGLELKKLSSRF